MKEHGRGFQNMYGTYSFWRFHTELRPSEVDPRFKFFFYKKYTVTKNPTATIFEWEVPQRIASFETHFFRTLFVCGALTRKLWPWLFSLRFPIFAGRSRFAALSRLRTGITRTKKFLHTFPIDILKAECVENPWVPAPEKFQFVNLGLRTVL